MGEEGRQGEVGITSFLWQGLFGNPALRSILYFIAIGSRQIGGGPFSILRESIPETVLLSQLTGFA